MTKTLAAVLASLALASPFAARSQTAPDTAAQLATQQVLALAPQLALLAGSAANMQALAAGLVLGRSIVLNATTLDGISQTVTIAPQATLTPVAAAQVLENTRQALIVRGIGTPTPEQVGVALTGGTLTTPVGSQIVSGTLTGTVNPAAMQVTRQVAGLAPFGSSSANLQSLTTGLTTGRPITLAGTTPAGAPTTLTFGVPGGAMSAFEASQALQFAGQLLAAQGIVNPTPEQVRAALLGGVVQGPASVVTLRGVLEGRGTVQTATSATGTSFSPTVNTSASQVTGTSFSPTVVPPPGPATPSATPGTTPPANNGAPSIAVQMQGRR